MPRPTEYPAPGQDPSQPTTPETTAVALSAKTILAECRVVQFRGRAMLLEGTPYPHFIPLHRDRFDRIGYRLLGGATRSRISDVFAFLSSTAEDLTDNQWHVLFGTPLSDLQIEADTPIEHYHANKPRVWDMRRLEWAPDIDPQDCVWRCPLPPVTTNTPVPWILDLAGQDFALYEDIMQSIAPIIMRKKPDGVIWWVGDGANGKSTLMDALYRLFPGQFSSITVKRLEDGRDTPSLNGHLANVVKESSEARIEDSETYKAIGTHENFRVHKFHSQDDIEIRGNMHHIFSANIVPSFNDKGHSAKRRTFIVPFNERFESDPTFEERTFTPQMFGHLISEMVKYAKRLERQGFRYKWSAASLSAKVEYDSSANNAEEFAGYLIHEGVVAFNSFKPVEDCYVNWCAEMGYVPLGRGHLRRAMRSKQFNRSSQRSDGGQVLSYYHLPSVNPKELQPYNLMHPGLFTLTGFEPEPDPEPVIPTETTTKPPDEEPEPPSFLKGRW